LLLIAITYNWKSTNGGYCSFREPSNYLSLLYPPIY
jgi:hypothetical protein